MIEVRARCGRLHRIHRGVYAVGRQEVSRRGWWMAATLGGGESSTLVARPAGAAWNLREWTGRPAINVPQWKRSTGRIEVHCARIPPDERTVRYGIPITTVARTIFDLASVLDDATLARVIEEAEKQELSSPLSLPASLERHGGERGSARLRRVLGGAGYGKGVRLASDLRRLLG